MLLVNTRRLLKRNTSRFNKEGDKYKVNYAEIDMYGFLRLSRNKLLKEHIDDIDI